MISSAPHQFTPIHYSFPPFIYSSVSVMFRLNSGVCDSVWHAFTLLLKSTPRCCDYRDNNLLSRCSPLHTPQTIDIAHRCSGFLHLRMSMGLRPQDQQLQTTIKMLHFRQLKLNRQRSHVIIRRVHWCIILYLNKHYLTPIRKIGFNY